MRILIDIGHPAHVHYFKNMAKILSEKDNKFFFTCREKEFEIELLKYYNFSYISLGKKFNSKIGKILGLIIFEYKLMKIALKFKPDMFLSAGSMYAAHVSWLLHKPHISLEDTGNKEQVNIYKPFTEIILTSDFFPFDYGEKQIRYRSFQELAYLHPHYYKSDREILNYLNLGKDEKFILIRLVAWNATHDTGQKGIKEKELAKIIKKLEENAFRVYISSEAELPVYFECYKIEIPPHLMHDALYYADIYIGEGATMAMETALLGTPSIYVNSLKASNCEQMEKEGLMEICPDSKRLIDSVDYLVDHPDLKELNRTKAKQLIETKIDLTEFLMWFIENYPESVSIMKGEPEFQGRFR